MINAKGPSFELFLWLSPRAANTEQKVCKPRVCLWTHVIWTNGSSLLCGRFFTCRTGSPLLDSYLAMLLCGVLEGI